MHRTGNLMGDNQGSGKFVISLTQEMHSSYYIYEGESTNNNYVSEVKNCLRRFKTQ